MCQARRGAQENGVVRAAIVVLVARVVRCPVLATANINYETIHANVGLDHSWPVVFCPADVGFVEIGLRHLRDSPGLPGIGSSRSQTAFLGGRMGPPLS